MRTCEINECEAPHVARGLCRNHYAQAKTRGVFTNLRIRNGKQGCSVEDCNLKHHCRGYCRNHYSKWLRWGDSLAPAPKEPAFCECGEPVKSRGLCKNHYYEWYTNHLFGSDEPPTYKKDVVGYQAAHVRIRRVRGRAANHECVDCGGKSRDWSLRANVENTMCDESGKYGGTYYSLDVYDYDARCGNCHKAYDARHGNRRDNAYARGAVEE